ncbi:MAG: hypothetical protein ACRD6W_11715 [Nitrososphaerales archaeon]
MSTKSSGTPHPNWARRCLCAIGLVVAGALAAACGGGSASPGVASLGSTTTTTASSAAQGTGKPSKAQGAVAFSKCMRSHGVPNFPTPVANDGHVTIHISSAIANAPQFKSAMAHCRSLLPGGGEGPTITPADKALYLKGVACMRSHGFRDFPDPTFSNNQVRFVVPASIDQNSAQFKQAVQTCERLIPAGLPYSDNGGS